MGLMSDGMAVGHVHALAGLVGSILVRSNITCLDAATQRVFSDAVMLNRDPSQRRYWKAGLQCSPGTPP